MLEPLATPDIWEEQLSEQKHFEHSTRPLVNILRLPWEASLASGGFSAWEERASVWSTQHGQCRFIILLLDPLPMIGYTMTTKKTERLSQRPPELRSRRREISELSDPEHGRQHRAGVEAAQSIDLQDVSRLHGSTQRCSHEYNQSADSSNGYCMFTGHSTRVPLLRNLVSQTLRKRPRHASEMRFVDSNSDVLKKNLFLPYSTPAGYEQGRTTPLEGLLLIIVHDTSRILQSIDLTLTQMDLDMLDDVLVQLHVDNWRRVLYKFDIELRNIEGSITEFTDLIMSKTRNDYSFGAGKVSKATSELLGQLFTESKDRLKAPTDH